MKNIVYEDKKLAEKNEQRQTLLMLSGKLKVYDEKTLIQLLGIYFPNSEIKNAKLDLMIENMKKDWLLDVCIDDKNILRVQSIATTNNWIGEASANRVKRHREAFGYPFEEPTTENLYQYYFGKGI